MVTMAKVMKASGAGRECLGVSVAAHLWLYRLGSSLDNVDMLLMLL